MDVIAIIFTVICLLDLEMTKLSETWLLDQSQKQKASQDYQNLLHHVLRSITLARLISHH